MGFIVGETVSKRKRRLADLVKEHLHSLGYSAETVDNRKNAAGHTDQVVVDSDIGLVHISFSSSLEPNASISAGDYVEGNQDFLVDKSYVAFGWNTKDGRTMIMFIHVNAVQGRLSLTKSEIKELRNRELSTVLSSK